MGAEFPPETVSRIEMELARRTAAGTKTSRAQLIVEAVDRAFPLPQPVTPENEQQRQTA